MLSGNTFTYNGILSQIYNLAFMNITTEEDKSIGGNLEYVTYRQGKNPKNTIQEAKYNSNFEFEVEFVSEHRLDEDLDTIYNWLLNQPSYKKLYVGTDDFYYNCVFTNPSYQDYCGQDGHGIYAIKATMKCDSVFKWKEHNITYSADELMNVVSEVNTSSVREYTYPTLIIKTGNTGGNISVQNVTDNNRLVTLTNTLANDTITISYYPATIKSLLNDNNIAVFESFNKHFFRLLQGTNRIGIVGDISEITLTYQIGGLIKC